MERCNNSCIAFVRAWTGGLTEPATDLENYGHVPILRSDWDMVDVGLIGLGTHVEEEINLSSR